MKRVREREGENERETHATNQARERGVEGGRQGEREDPRIFSRRYLDLSAGIAYITHIHIHRETERSSCAA